MLSYVFRNGNIVRRVDIPKQPMRVGRETGDIVLPFDQCMSAEHAILTRQGDRRFRVDDLHSKNGIFDRGKRVDFMLMQPGDLVQIGSTFMSIEESDTGDVEIAFVVRRPPEQAKTTLPLQLHERTIAAREIDQLVYASDQMRDVIEQALELARTDEPLLLVGETGTGKDVLARFIGANSAYARPFRPQNCAALTRELFQSEVFGIGAAVATGVAARSGLFVDAEGGTLFLDEIGDIDEELQASLLSAIETREIRPAGAARPRSVHTRVILATNRPENLRQDLENRCQKIEIPPLRERPDDIAALAEHFLRRAGTSISRKALDLLRVQAWPGNVRQLKKVLERAALRHGGGGVLHVEQIEKMLDLPVEPIAQSHRARQVAHTRRDIARALRENGGNKSAAARTLRMSRSGLLKALRRDEECSTRGRKKSLSSID